MWGRVLLGLVLTIPPALAVAYLAGGFWYERDHKDFGRTHTRNPHYSEMLRGYEAEGGVVGALPGLAILLTLGGLEKRKQRELVAGRPADDDDETVWPPPPHDGS